VGARSNPKLATHYSGPLKVLERVGAYKLQLPETTKIHPVFHVSLLKKVIGNYNMIDELPTELACDDGTSLEPEGILAKRVIKNGEDAVSQVLIQWKVQILEDAMWKEEFYVKSQFPHLSLEDKASLEEMGIKCGLRHLQ